MRILVVGAGGTGGYFGGRPLEAGRDVTFLVRPRRAAELAEVGLTISSPCGDVSIPSPPHVLAGQLDRPFHLILLSCKAYDLESAMGDFAPAVGAETAILPLLNGMRHIERLTARFGEPAVLGGLCAISATLGEQGQVLHLNTSHSLSFGERQGGRSARVEAIAEIMEGARFDWHASDAILLAMWEKWVLLATVAGITCLMRAAIGDVVAAGGSALVLELLEESRSIAAHQGYRPDAAFLDKTRSLLTDPDSPLMASMLRDIERGARVEADHVIGDLLERAPVRPEQHRSLLRIAYVHLKSYEIRRAREGA